jgi:hypothetical protein
MQCTSRYLTLPTLVLVVGTAPIAAVHAQSGSGKGMTLTMTVSSTSPGEPKPSIMTVGKLTVSASGQVRSDVLPDGSSTPRPAPTGDKPPMMVPGTYALRKKGTDTTFVVDPTQKKYWVVIAPGAGAAKALGHINYTNVEVSAQRVQPDSTIEGIAVQHWRVIDNAILEKKTSQKSTTDIYTAPGLNIDLGTEFNPATFAGMVGDSAYGAKRAAAWGQAMHGVPLLMRMQMEILVYEGKPMSMGMMMQATNISRGDPPASLFVLPAGYTLVHSTQ